MSESRNRPKSPFWNDFDSQSEDLLLVREEMNKRRGTLGAIVDQLGSWLSHPLFFTTLLLSHVIWLVCNLPWVPWEPVDPYPFTFLATVTSAEAPFIALLILMHQQRTQRIDELRQETAFQLTLHSERETTRLLRMVRAIHEKLGIEDDGDEDEFERMMRDIKPREVLNDIACRLDEANDQPPGIDDGEAETEGGAREAAE